MAEQHSSKRSSITNGAEPTEDDRPLEWQDDPLWFIRWELPLTRLVACAPCKHLARLHFGRVLPWGLPALAEQP
eukprot:1161976-Pelagomonas_calceolata.AAC.20